MFSLVIGGASSGHSRFGPSLAAARSRIPDLADSVNRNVERVASQVHHLVAAIAVPVKPRETCR